MYVVPYLTWLVPGIDIDNMDTSVLSYAYDLFCVISDFLCIKPSNPENEMDFSAVIHLLLRIL